MSISRKSRAADQRPNCSAADRDQRGEAGAVAEGVKKNEAANWRGLPRRAQFGSKALDKVAPFPQFDIAAVYYLLCLFGWPLAHQRIRYLWHV
jgi:hypothetical protein